MSVTVQAGIVLALLCAFATNVGFLLKHRGASAAPDVSLRHPIRSAVGLFRSKWFAAGMLVGIGAWALHVSALALAPLSIVQSVIAGGLVFLTVLAERFFGSTVGTRQWAGVGLTALGLVLLAVSIPNGGDGNASYSMAGMIVFESALLALGTLLVFSPQLGSRERHGVTLGTAAGILFGVSDVALKALTTSVGHEGALGLLSPWLATAVIASVIAFYASARGFQKAEAVPVITLTSAAANVSAIAGGILVFGDPMRSDPFGVAIQSLAFILVIAAASLTPAPLRAARAQA